MMDALDVERRLIERITPKTHLSPQYAQLIHQLTDETADEVKELLREKRALQQVTMWLLEKTKDLNTAFWRKKVLNPQHPWIEPYDK